MDPETWRRLAQLLDDALEVPSAERAAWIEGLGGADAELRAELSEWLREHEGARGFLAAPLAPGASWEREAWLPLAPGTTIGSYRILRAIGLGGTSVVYEVEQDDPPARLALKVFHVDLDSDRARERFREEARILATLRHPAIARIHAAGTETVGRRRQPWIAMDLVRGARTVQRYCREEGLALRSRLELFARVCDAVAHGHQRAVIHRDLKPANILVDSAGDPRVIDFGLAKACGGDPARNAEVTGGLQGTLAWMSPELLGGEPGPADTRIDVYALGVVLYELLCGALPHDVERLPLEEAVRAVRTLQPLRPSRVAGGLDGDLDAIALMALAKDPEARYRSAGELAGDVRRYLARVPVVARRPSLLHRSRLAMIRHRRATLVAAGCAGLFVGAIALGASRAAGVEARERAKAQEVTDFLKSILALADPAYGRRADLTMREVLDDAARRIDAELVDAPEARAEVHALVGSAWRELGLLERAEEHLRSAAAVLRATRRDPAPLAGTLSMLSEVLLDAGRGREAEEVLLEAQGLYAGLPDLPEFYLGIVTNKLAEARRLQGQLASAEELARRALGIYRRSLGELHPAVAAALRNLAAIQRDRGALAEAEVSLRAALSIQREATGEDSLATARARLALVEVLDAAGDVADAPAQLAEAGPRLERLLPADHAERGRLEALRRRFGSGN